MWYVCSDIHSGTAASRANYLYLTVIPQLKTGDTLVLLGDIFDYWFSSFDLGLEQLSESWLDLLDKLEELRDKQINVIFVPGNHDSFVFYNEWNNTSDSPEWLEHLYTKGGHFGEVYAATTYRRHLSSVATIYYPAFLEPFGDKTIVFTHGHWTERIWPFITDEVARI